ncbi:carbohydrate-binding wsc [Trichoderma arundinaceum]|uniref:Carbohydrate-binding wsc n=1 Tax=Trichoderma arundinaceum TaxID=490622 RepID=A0A395NNB6_TRIAR|nr:carbohydrate-binding wsc [Trichoderma arundinaceum]
MASYTIRTLQKGYLILLVLALSSLIPAIPVNVCSTFNTGETPLNVSIYQTNGLCSGFCIGKSYAFAITQQNSCWCSNYYPDKGSTTDTKDCDSPCPAYPTEFCGGHNLYGYILLNDVAPSGTKTAPPSSSTTSSQSTGSPTSSTTPPPSSNPNSASTTDNGNPSPTQSGDPTGDQNGVTVKKSGLGTGGIVGIVVGVVGGLLVIAGALLFWFLRRRKQNRDEYRDDPSVRGSSSGMVGSVPPEMSVNGGSPASPVSAVNRNSTIQIDPRMDPFKQGLYIRGSHESLNTLRDDHDYSRRIQPPKVLRATNPDPEEG